MKVPQEAIDLAKKFEGFRAYPYICPGGYWTIGYGHRCSSDHPAIDKKTAEVYLEEDLKVAMDGVLGCTVRQLSRGQLAALTDFVFNLGIGNYKKSTLKKAVDKGDIGQMKVQLRRWVHASGEVLKGLVDRREAEIRLLGEEPVVICEDCTKEDCYECGLWWEMKTIWEEED